MFTTLPKLTFAANGIGWPDRSDTVSATQVRPPASYAVLIEAFPTPDETEPSSRVQSGIATCRSRGNDTTVTRRGFVETCTSRLTSLRLPSAPGSVQRSPKASLTWSSHSSVPTTRSENGSS